MSDPTQTGPAGVPCPPHVDRALALLSAAVTTRDGELSAVAADARRSLRRTEPLWLLTQVIPAELQPDEDGWLPAALAEHALCEVVDELDLHADIAAQEESGAAEVLTGLPATCALMEVLRSRPGTREWAANRDRAIVAGDRLR